MVKSFGASQNSHVFHSLRKGTSHVDVDTMHRLCFGQILEVLKDNITRRFSWLTPPWTLGNVPTGDLHASRKQVVTSQCDTSSTRSCSLTSAIQQRLWFLCPGSAHRTVVSLGVLHGATCCTRVFKMPSLRFCVHWAFFVYSRKDLHLQS
jgi:hypothetical protein